MDKDGDRFNYGSKKYCGNRGEKLDVKVQGD